MVFNGLNSHRCDVVAIDDWLTVKTFFSKELE